MNGTTIMLAAMALALPASAAPLDPALADIGFLVGHWSSSDGKIADTGGSSKGTSSISVEASGHVLLRRDHTDLFDQNGKAAGGFDQIMMIYPENGAIHADYSDGKHIIHYDSATIAAGHSVAFTSAQQPGAPVFKLSYELTRPKTMAMTFAMAAPGQTEFKSIASGTVHKSR